jgi:uncharacterized DUF497 family protein
LAWIRAGQTEAGRGLFAIFTIRAGQIRLFSARDMSREEREEVRRAQAGQAPANA